MPGTRVTSEGDHAQPGWTTSRRGQDSPWKSQSEWQRTEVNGESMFMVWPTLGSRIAEEQNRIEQNDAQQWVTTYKHLLKGRIPRHRYPRRHPREDRREDVDVGVVECGLNAARSAAFHTNRGRILRVSKRVKET